MAEIVMVIWSQKLWMQFVGQSLKGIVKGGILMSSWIDGWHSNVTLWSGDRGASHAAIWRDNCSTGGNTGSLAPCWTGKMKSLMQQLPGEMSRAWRTSFNARGARNVTTKVRSTGKATAMPECLLTLRGLWPVLQLA